MSYTQFVCTAKCQVADDFDLKQYVTGLADFISNHIDDDSLDQDIKWAFEELTYERTVEKLSDFFSIVGNQLLLTVDSEEQDTSVHDWLIDQVLNDVMVSEIMEINAATIDSRMGVECGTSYYKKDGTFIGSDDVYNIIEQHIKMTS
jgi:hypothetical protein